MARQFTRKLILETGEEYPGYGFGGDAERVCEVVFNTSMAGYQEIVSDPSYTDQAVVMSYPLIGNYGICDEDYETKTPTVGALVVSEYNDLPSNFRSTKSLGEVLEEYGIPGIEGVDTRALVRTVREGGSRRALICDISRTYAEAKKIIDETPVPHDAVSRVSCKKRWYSRTPDHILNVVALDCGIKLNIVRMLNARGCNVTVVPYDTCAEEVLKEKPDGLFLSNGPGDPEDVQSAVRLIRDIRGKLPVFGICLGHQIISLAYGGKTYKLKFGHRGGNHPVKDLNTGRVEITSQNHSYAVDADSLRGTGLEITHINLLDGTVEGAECPRDRVFSVQYHPESAPGPQDSRYLFDKFISYMTEGKKNAKEN